MKNGQMNSRNIYDRRNVNVNAKVSHYVGAKVSHLLIT